MTRRILLLAAAALLAALPASATIFTSPGQPNVDQPVTFSLTLSSGTIVGGSIVWSFGDGTTAAGPAVVQKTYGSAGTYAVNVRYMISRAPVAGPLPASENAAVTVSERRRIISLTPAPMLGQPVSFRAENFLSASIQWSFGDGAPAIIGGPSISHVYSSPGNFQVTARDFGGSSLSAITLGVSIGVDVSKRRITYAPPRPAAGFPVTFTAAGFYTAQILWNFGDGNNPVTGSTAIVHAFAKPGKYTVQAWDWNGAVGGPTAAFVPVGEPAGMRAAFQIAVLQLRFENGLTYKVVPRRFAPLAAFVDIKYEGTGLFQAQWLVDGMPFGAVSQALPMAQSATFDSGRILGLPTELTGMHEVSLRILSPDIGFKIPVIRYFVSAETGLPLERGLDLKVETAEGLQGVDCTLTMGELRAAAGPYFILHGKLRSSLPGAVKFGLLRVHLGTDLIDQQLVRGLAPGEARGFTTSFRSLSSGTRILYITLYDITDASAPRLLALQKITVRSGP